MPAADLRILVIGYGNPGRRDDGLGPAAVAALESRALPGVTLDSDYQLTVEDAAAVAACDVVVFVDAATRGPEPFGFGPLAPSPAAVGFSSHSVSPGAVLALARDLFGAEPRGYLLGIRGYEFDAFGEALSAGAQANLAAALDFLHAALRDRSFHRADVPEPLLAGPAAPDEGDRSCKTAST